MQMQLIETSDIQPVNFLYVVKNFRKVIEKEFESDQRRCEDVE